MIDVQGGSSTPVVLPASMVVAGMIVGAAIIALDASRARWQWRASRRDLLVRRVHQTEVVRNQGRAPASIISNVGEVVSSVRERSRVAIFHGTTNAIRWMEAVRGQDGAEITRCIGNLT